MVGEIVDEKINEKIAKFQVSAENFMNQMDQP